MDLAKSSWLLPPSIHPQRIKLMHSQELNTEVARRDLRLPQS